MGVFVRDSKAAMFTGENAVYPGQRPPPPRFIQTSPQNKGGVSHGDRKCWNTIFMVHRNGYKIQNGFAVVINYTGKLKLVRQTFSESYNLHIYSSWIFRLRDVRPAENESLLDDVKVEVTYH